MPTPSHLIFCFFLLTLSACAPPAAEHAADDKITPATPALTEAPWMQHLLDSLHLAGSILIFDETGNRYTSNDFARAKSGQLPASTFKIPNTIIALETSVASNPEHLFKWDGTDRWLDAWERDLTLEEAFAASCVPCYQEVARAVGPERMRTELDRLGYPGMVFNPETIDNFWLGGDSRISQWQQIDFLRRIYHGELPIRPATQRAIREIMVIEKTTSYVLSGKTGWSTDGENNNGWFVGFVERGEKVYYFATNVSPGLGFDMADFASSRLLVTKLALTNMEVL